MDFLHDFSPFIKDLKEDYPDMIVVGDYNIVHLDIDIHNPTRKDSPSGFRPEERQWMNEWFDNDFNDAYRTLHPEEINYSWWSYRAGARRNNKGWRIDYISVTDSLKSKINATGHLSEAVHSDHCPVFVDLNL